MMALFDFSEFYRVTNSWYVLFQMNLVYVTWSFIRTVLCGGRRHGHSVIMVIMKSFQYNNNHDHTVSMSID